MDPTSGATPRPSRAAAPSQAGIAPPREIRLAYVLSVVAVLVAFEATYFTWPLLKPTPWAFFFAAVMASAWLCGLGPSLLAMALSAAGGAYFFVEPYYGFSLEQTAIPMAVFILVSAFISSLASARGKAERSERELRKWFEATVSGIGD